MGVFSALSKEGEPQREGEQRRQARIGQNRERDHNMKAHQQPSGRHREQQSERQAEQPRRKEGAQNIERRSPSAARQEDYRER